MTFPNWSRSVSSRVGGSAAPGPGPIVLGLVALALVAVPTPARAASAEAGKAVFEKQCKVCHSIAGEGGKMAKTGGPLDGVGTKRTADWIKAYLQDPKSQIPNSKMPKLKLSAGDLDDVSAYLLSLK